MAISRKLGAVLGGAALVLSAACTQDLSVPNNNNPDVQRALANPGDVKALAISSIENWFTTAGYYDPWAMLNVTADLQTANFGNFGMRFNNVEPRIPYANDAANGDVEAARDPWNYEYQALGAANDVLRAVKGGIVFPDESGAASQDVTDQYKALALWAQAGALMQIALIFDKGFIVDEDFDASTQTPSLAPYTDVAAAAQSKLDALIALTAGKDWTYQDSDFPLYGQTLTATSLNRIANTMAAQLLAYTPRDKAAAAKVDWAKVLQYANNGIGTGPAGEPFDWAIQGDGGSQWYVYLTLYFDFPSWMAVDQKLIHKMSACVPEKFDGTLVPPETTCAANPTGAHDARVATDFSGDAHTSGADFVYVGAPIGSR
jgi:hypothetical protein